MRILYVNTHYYTPQSFGGMAVTLDQLCKAMSGRGHTVGVLCGFRRDGPGSRIALAKMKVNQTLDRPKLARDDRLGYAVWRSWTPSDHVADVARMFRPDVIVAMGGKIVPVVQNARLTGLPIVTQVHDVEFHFHDGDFRSVADLPCVANSKFTADVYRRAFGANPDVIYPMVDHERYATTNTGRNVVFINLHLHKGLERSIAIAARCPDIPFDFVGSLPAGYNSGVADTVIPPNVTLRPSQSDMREVYARARLILAPSKWEEAFGRVVAEAQISGIPAVASTQGGLPEAVGPGGVALDLDQDVARWADTVREVWADDTVHQRLGQAAYTHARRPEMDQERQLLHQETVLIQAIG